MKLIFLNAKINEVTKINEMKSEYRNVADVRVKEIIILINVIVDDEKDEWENDVINDIWKKRARKTDTRRRYASSMLIDIILFIES